jgi:hypothetical protein
LFIFRIFRLSPVRVCGTPPFNRLTLFPWEIDPMRRRLRFAGVLFCCAGFGTALHAQSGGSYAIVNSTVDSGAGESVGDTFRVRYTAGQPDAAYSAGGMYEVRGGFWGSRSNPPTDLIFADAFE